MKRGSLGPDSAQTRKGSKDHKWRKSPLERKEEKEKARGVDNSVTTRPQETTSGRWG